MADDIDRDDVSERPTTAAPPPRRRKRWGVRILAVLVLGPILVLSLWTLITLNYSYSEGERAGYIQKFSKKGWLCKTWEGEIAMVNMPGTAPEIFRFTVKDDAIARDLERTMGQRVSISYRQHKGVPTSCFGETDYFVYNVRPVADPYMQGAPTAPMPPMTQPTTPQPGTVPGTTPATPPGTTPAPH
jgi:hypothetical protein